MRQFLSFLCLSFALLFGNALSANHSESRSHSSDFTLFDGFDCHYLIALGKPAINPKTDKPYFFIFVDNTSQNSKGTFESPYNTLVQAQNNSKPYDIIYVFTGNETSEGMDAGIVLQDNQKLLGSSTPHRIRTTIGRVTIPALTRKRPIITNTSNSAITSANNNEISGIHVIANDVVLGISFTNITNASINQNRIDVIGSAAVPPTSIGLNFLGSGGKISIEKNSINQTNGLSTGLALLTVAPGSNYNIKHNRFKATVSEGAQGIEFGHAAALQTIGDFDTLNISNNLFTGQGGFNRGIGVGGFGFSGTGHLIFNNNTFLKQTTNANNQSVVLIAENTGANLTVDIENNVWKDTVNPSSFATLSVGSIPPTVPPVALCLKLTGNKSDNTNIGYLLGNIVGGTFIAEISNNVGSIVEVGVITPGTCP